MRDTSIAGDEEGRLVLAVGLLLLQVVLILIKSTSIVGKV